jgi:hypothetical protein
MYLDPNIWGPSYWFFLHTIALNYPNTPNAVIKKKYYDFIQNLPLFLPDNKIATNFEKLLNLYPVSSYLDNKESFIRWLWFIHNKINEMLEKPKISLNHFYINYYDKYKPEVEKNKINVRLRMKIIYSLLIIFFLFIIFYFYNK